MLANLMLLTNVMLTNVMLTNVMLTNTMLNNTVLTNAMLTNIMLTNAMLINYRFMIWKCGFFQQIKSINCKEYPQSVYFIICIHSIATADPRERNAS